MQTNKTKRVRTDAGLVVRTGVKAGGWSNHAQTLLA
jgi:hypothetical protein